MQTSTCFLLVVTFSCITGALAAGRKLPKGIFPCARNLPNFDECVLKNAQAAIPIIAKGVPSYGLIGLDPLFVPEFRIDDSGSSSQAQIDLTMTNLTCRGAGGTRIRSLIVNPDSGVLQWHGLMPKLSMIGHYLAKGRVLILPIRGNGAMNFTMENVEFTFTARLVSAGSRGGHEYIKPVDNKLSFNMTKCYIRLENLFNGEKALNDQMNYFLNENWREVVQELGQPISEVLNAASLEVVKALTKHVPLDELFPSGEKSERPATNLKPESS